MESNFELGDEYDGDSDASEDCSDEFEQGLDAPSMVQAKILGHFLDVLHREDEINTYRRDMIAACRRLLLGD